MLVREMPRKDGIAKSENHARTDKASKKAASDPNNYKILSEQYIMGKAEFLFRARIWALRHYVGITQRGG
jgi:hypothetical protein